MKTDTNEEKIKKLGTYKRLINLGLTAICLGMEIGLFAYHWLEHFQYSVVEPLRDFWFKGHLLEIAIYAAILLMLSLMYGGMRLGYLKNAEIIFSQVFATLIANLVIYAELSVMAFQLFHPKVFIIMMMEQTAVIIIYINIANKVYRSLFPPRKLLLIHGDRPIDGICAKFESRSDKYEVTRTAHVKEGYDKLCRLILEAYECDECNAVVLGDISVEERSPLLKFCYGHSIRVYLMPKISDVILTGAEELHVFDSPMLLTREYCLTMEQRFVKRCIDILFALVLLIITSPFMLLTAIAIKLYDGGPILYKQVRCTVNQRRFSIMKFRSMRTDAEGDGVARLAQKNDNRVTPIGRVIRKCRIDELPQLFNILKGDMSFIGPRPERPEIIAQYIEVMPEFVFRMKVKAGLAGYAQVY
ncbi:MAG: sugar transferase, partial [Lachnospiraceae bacterium]|nr:sugar transferase [Lachnospiraceae bacterium]